MECNISQYSKIYIGNSGLAHFIETRDNLFNKNY